MSKITQKQVIESLNVEIETLKAENKTLSETLKQKMSELESAYRLRRQSDEEISRCHRVLDMMPDAAPAESDVSAGMRDDLSVRIMGFLFAARRRGSDEKRADA